jgi:hypothetical protein
MHSQWRTSASYRDSTGLADARIDVRAFSEQMMPAFATEIVCCSITCRRSDRMLHGRQARVAPCGWHGRNHMRSHAVLCCEVDSLAPTGAWQVLHVACRSTPRVRLYTATWLLHVACCTIYISHAAVRCAMRHAAPRGGSSAFGQTSCRTRRCSTRRDRRAPAKAVGTV